MSPLNQQILLKSFKNLLCIAAEKEIQLLLWKKEDDMRPEKERGKKELNTSETQNSNCCL
ncbi:hypothetical protein E1A91_D07G194400v1 [Gossypium mustelinum]|uniref:Uncharacterized protein n=1 Tax=Gossypium mustelinum TaxID=34275 RepID=A0A5D2U9T3_GOSMU|nr:hypothetical protein E1A91_D07G194400v1 [Gossypium mustelinum]TYI74355.1 hypothetical protein E1A91_D07G194400v1 [Gossypium mustelinum]